MSTQSDMKSYQILKWIKVIILGSIGNTIVGGLTGFIGSFCLQHHPLISISIIWIGALAGLIGGLLHAIMVFFTSYFFTTSTKPNQPKSLSQELLFILTQAPLWSTIGATISYTILVENPLHFNHQASHQNHLSFWMVLLTALIGTFLIALYSIVMFWFTKSESHLWILQNGLVLLFNESFKPSYHDLLVNLDSLDTDPLFDHDTKIRLAS
ncbi:uncharacterized protein MELLADRAFT_109601 [Melampsora larici-populina 98AG31]|uniref:Uncharacterized protein n=1 Tax=Melampsora larici-populina (strain 98AG31 / pathotype 3-4-7) TaxID=747676 RepID=F4RX05_MELLP|nr:uncharacterized protein MELLADRAFT_109601 [Melampsora larici-populina 98AG31]EGG03129.1 hypothetical protein MELLADRAFT_109601 [Melampsora larici-populina 98AG31]